ncbi:MAG: prepilin-type N-terminal cleavage/methylation domain-containing protein [Neomegalonema sp.]|nr:prepilin-type N-terminal cleavage/methylation domain-containing protein [Neomegalonema sp.]
MKQGARRREWIGRALSRRKGWPQASRRAGATLIEMLVALGLLGVIAAIALPRLLPSDARLLAQDSAAVLQFLRSGREEALALGAPQRLVLFAQEGQLSWRPLYAPPLPGPAEARSGAALSLETRTRAALHLRRPDAGLVFYADGASSGGQVQLERGALVARIGVDALTGAVVDGGVQRVETVGQR